MSGSRKVSIAEVVAVVRCVDSGCKKTREIRPGEVDPDDGVPFCQCGCPMVIDHAIARFGG